MATPTEIPSGESQTPGLRLSDTLILATAPIVGAAMTFAYEAGFLSWYGIPYIFVRIDATTVLVTATAAGALGVAILGYARMIPIMPWRVVFAFAYLSLLPFFLALCGYVALATIPWRPWWTFTWHAVLGVALEVAAYYAAKDFLVRPIREYKEEGDWGARWARRMREAGAGKDLNLEDAFHSRVRETLGTRAAGWVLGLIVGMVILNWWGVHRAATDKVHVLARSPEPCIVIRRYGEGLLCVAVDTTNWRILPRYRIVPFVESNVDLSTIVTGPLRPVTLPVGSSSGGRAP
jgi:hypothetical protein